MLWSVKRQAPAKETAHIREAIKREDFFFARRRILAYVYCKEKLTKNQQTMLLERVFFTLKFSTRIWTRRKHSARQTIFFLSGTRRAGKKKSCHEARSAIFFFPCFSCER